MIHDEIERLPERFRASIVLCDLEACSLDDAARQLGWPLGTVKSRLNRGRRRLRDRLLRRGLAPGLAGTALSGLNSSVKAVGSEGLFESTVRVVLLTATRRSTSRPARCRQP